MQRARRAGQYGFGALLAFAVRRPGSPQELLRTDKLEHAGGLTLCVK
jgi:hypothetical protein